MKKILFISAITILLTTACKNKEAEEKLENEPAAIALQDTVSTDNTEVATTEDPVTIPADGDRITVTGKVIAVNVGKDGYTATITTKEEKEYSATISMPNLKDPKQYRTVSEGDIITVTGEVTNLENDVLIKVEELEEE
ncbi:hypothetical protein GCM10007424_20660 [Flavobacterium suaedae]|uniref:DUF5666 domain-containing protein n=1 Tax=Flavobacterium suaedae TaxID=1767027 RepID=A0ABQ1JZS5_9FLAO|nr:hypothetical protein [Flavobacterium suaedae]GGB80407.1 hypothetical protein GCM10007424_20660 [Flavobacterium suaedae]